MKENLQIKVIVKIANPLDLEKYEELELIVDTGEMFSIIKKERLIKLGIKPIRERKLITATGEVVTRKVGAAWYEIKNKGEILSEVIFGEKNDTEVLGMHTLEGMCLSINTKTGEIEPIELYLL